MGINTGIEWTDATWNPVRGCSRVSEGCRYCYAETVAMRFSHEGQPYANVVRLSKKEDGRAPRAIGWNGEADFIGERLLDPMRWQKPRRIFVNSMSDLFHERLSFERIAAIYGVMAASPQHTFQVLTKRPARALSFFEWARPNVFATCLHETGALLVGHPEMRAKLDRAPITRDFDNVILGVSVEDQRTADERVEMLMSCVASRCFVSYEPALSGVVFSPSHLAAIDQVIIGGESGRHARAFEVAWARSTIRQCRDAGVAVFVKQMGSNPYGLPDDLSDPKGGNMDEWPEDLRVREQLPMARFESVVTP